MYELYIIFKFYSFLINQSVDVDYLLPQYVDFVVWFVCRSNWLAFNLVMLKILENITQAY